MVTITWSLLVCVFAFASIPSVSLSVQRLGQCVLLPGGVINALTGDGRTHHHLHHPPTQCQIVWDVWQGTSLSVNEGKDGWLKIPVFIYFWESVVQTILWLYAHTWQGYLEVGREKILLHDRHSLLFFNKINILTITIIIAASIAHITTLQRPWSLDWKSWLSKTCLKSLNFCSHHLLLTRCCSWLLISVCLEEAFQVDLDCADIPRSTTLLSKYMK